MSREAILSAALPVFFRYGYRKTTMDDISNEVGSSRQSLYNHFGNKEKFFREMVSYLALEGRRQFVEALAEDGAPLEERILRAFDLWTGRHVDKLHASPHTQEIARELCEALGEQHRDMQNSILAALTGALRAAKVGKKREIEAIALTLYASSKGLARLCDGRASYLEDLRKAIHVILPAGCLERSL